MPVCVNISVWFLSFEPILCSLVMFLFWVWIYATVFSKFNYWIFGEWVSCTIGTPKNIAFTCMDYHMIGFGGT